MAIWICDTHNEAGKISKRERYLPYTKKSFFYGMECEIRIMSEDNALALGWKALDW